MSEDAAGELHIDRRRYPRFNLKLPVEYTIVEQQRRCSAMVDNISLAGVLLLTDEPLRQGTNVVVHLPTDSEESLDIQAQIVRTSVVGELGVAFIAMTADEVERVTALVEKRSAL